MSSKWLDQKYIDQIMVFAKIMAKSRSINIQFRGDEETCFMLAMQADNWGLHPEFVAANSFFDTYGRISQTGKLVKSVLLAHESVKDVKTEYTGDWSLVNNKYKLGDDNIPRPLWNESVESELFFELKILLKDGNTHSEKVCMADIDPSIRALNEAWVSRPYNQIFNHTIRQIAFGRLSHLLNGIETNETYDEIQAVNKTASASEAERPSQNSKHDEATVHAAVPESIDEETLIVEPEMSKLVQELLEEAMEVLDLIQSELVDHHVKSERLSELVEKIGQNSDGMVEHEKEAITEQYRLLHEAFESEKEKVQTHA